MSAGTSTDLLTLARSYHALGFNVIPLNGDKRAIVRWKALQTHRQTADEIAALPFGTAAGTAAILGEVSAPDGRCLALIDADKAPGRAPLDNLLGQLGLSRDYAWAVLTPGKGGGWHVWFTVRGLADELEKKGLRAGVLSAPFPGTDHIELRWSSAIGVLPGSSHPEGGTYSWAHGNGVPPDDPPTEVDAGHVVRIGKWEGETADGHHAPASPLPDKIVDGARHTYLFSLAGTARRRGTGEKGILALLRAENEEKCAPPMPDSDLTDMARRAAAYKPGDPIVPPSEESAPDAGPAADETDDGEPLFYEAAHAEVLAQAWRGHYRWAAHKGTWRRWTGRVWEVVGEPQVVAAAQRELRRRYGRLLGAKQSKAEDERLRALHKAACHYQSVCGGLAFLKGAEGFYTDSAAWDVDAYALNCADGILDVRTQTLRSHDPGAMCTKIVHWRYSDETTTDAWQHHLELCLPDPDVRRQVQRDLGRALVDAVLEISLPIWYGVGHNGKSTTQDALQAGLGEYAHQAAKNLLMAAKNERHPTEVAELAGRRFVFSEEITAGARLDEAQVKKLTGGGPQTAHFMRQDNFTFPQTFTIFLLTNHHPTITGADKGIWSRVRLVPWTVSIPFAQQRPQDDVVAELVADGSWMLRWMVAGFADWLADHHWIAERVQAATAEYRAEQDRLSGFIADCCDERMHAESEVAELFDAYVAWCGASDEIALGKIAFGKGLRERGFGQTKGTGGRRVWTGIRLKGATSGSFSS